jgi:hypothetical protein
MSRAMAGTDTYVQPNDEARAEDRHQRLDPTDRCPPNMGGLGWPYTLFDLQPKGSNEEERTPDPVHPPGP